MIEDSSPTRPICHKVVKSGKANHRLSGERSDHLSTFLLKDVEFVACVYKGLVEDFAQQSVKAIAGKVVKIGRKRFSRMTIHAGGRQISAWDYYCYGLLKGDTAYGDKFIHDFLRLALLKRVERLPDEHLRLVSVSQLRFEDMNDNAVVSADAAIRMIEQEIRMILLAHGRIVQQLLMNGPALSLSTDANRSIDFHEEHIPHQISANGASPT
ncbi:hypothetical protein M2360_002265 [Rhizobium sp. SG_E_25_P2]|uniref:hypothetical protein n=1 Tax=Rhizobium sp. SG_E_25_P2 TaxID=2879942 RepID=UPI0024758199|nr:hypothetical protein [Rhizobium sp. SG_E_25_P2]MDH6266869.1 hypothetical protein [Rhizobium sp. SG_E_25_P2]